ncbi:MAG: hypothetical protein CMH50_03160, partial [Myxococcales bacterium]|nr:hypothetical protein [Myxococcales bacterium]
MLDHRPLTSALAMGEVLPIFIFDPYFFAPDKTSQMPHRIQFLLDSVHELKSKLNG